MTNGLLTALVLMGALNALLLLSVLFGLRSAQRKARDLEAGIRSFLTAPDANTPSPLALIVDQLAQVVARGVIAQAQTTIMGIKSGASRAAASAEAQANMARYPWLSVLAQLMPGAAKSLAKNPALLNLAGSMLQRNQGQQQQQQPAPGRDNGHQQPMDLTIGGI